MACSIVVRILHSFEIARLSDTAIGYGNSDDAAATVNSCICCNSHSTLSFVYSSSLSRKNLLRVPTHQQRKQTKQQTKQKGKQEMQALVKTWTGTFSQRHTKADNLWVCGGEVRDRPEVDWPAYLRRSSFSVHKRPSRNQSVMRSCFL